MKRIAWREFLLLTAPIAIIGLWGLWPQILSLHEYIAPTRPRITECRVRPATPLEISQGAHFGVTVRAVFPNSRSCPGMDSSFSRPAGGSADSSPKPQPSEWHDVYSEVQPRRVTYERTYAFARSAFSPPDQSLIATPRLRTSCTTFRTPQGPVVLTAKDIPAPDPAAARRANFRLTKVLVEHRSSDRVPKQDQHIDLYFEDVTDESQGLAMRRRCVGNWTWYDGDSDSAKGRSVRASAGMSSGRGNKLSFVRVVLYSPGPAMFFQRRAPKSAASCRSTAGGHRRSRSNGRKSLPRTGL